MTPRRKTYVAYALLLAFFAGVPAATAALHLPTWLGFVSALGSVMAFAVWSWTLLCPVCGTTLLWGSEGVRMVRRLLPPSKCPNCGNPIDR